MVCKASSIFFIVCSLLLQGCSFFDTGLANDKLTAAQIFSNNKLATAAVVGVYEDMAGKLNFLVAGASVYGGVYSDELVYHGGEQEKADFEKGNIAPTNTILQLSFWNTSYTIIESINRCIDGLSQYQLPDTSLRKQLIGECKVLRATMFFYLTMFFGDVPLTTISDYQRNESMPRTPLEVIKQTIIADLKEAKALLAPQYPGSGRGRVNTWCAATLLARMYLYDNNYELAEQEATSVISSGMYELLPPDGVFLINSREAILQIQPMIPGQYTMEGIMFIPGAPEPPSYLISPGLLQQFGNGDKRKQQWIGSVVLKDTTFYYPWKYKKRTDPTMTFKLTESVTVFRLAELYLTRAEAHAALEQLPAAIADVDLIRQRAGLPLIKDIRPNINASELLAEIQQQRRLEFFAELGHRFLDLKRTGKIYEVLLPVKPRWSKAFEVWPIPANQIVLNRNLVQNPGYPL